MPSVDDITPDLLPTQTQDFDFLREKGLAYVQQLSGRLWTDHNVHDPGITVLEVLCYALMDLGYRTNFDITDILTRPDGSTGSDAFHTARQIFTNSPVSVSDYRRLLIDIEGVRNAWLHVSDENELPFDEGLSIYAYCRESRLLHESQIPAINPNDREHVRNNERIFIKGLYSVRLELDEHPLFGDLNSSNIQLKLTNGPLSGYVLALSFPRWSAPDREGRETASLFRAETIDALAVEVINDTQLQPADFAQVRRSRFKSRWTISYAGQERILEPVSVSVLRAPAAARGLVRAAQLENGFNENDAFYGREALRRFSQRPAEIFRVFEKVRAKLMLNRNVCEDFLFDMDMIDTEDLVICVDLDVDTQADLESLQAEVFSVVENYLLPPVQFSTLSELLDRDVPVEAIFNGPPLEHGFLTDEAISLADLKQVYYTSDIVSLIMDIPGILNVRNLQYTVYFQNNTKKAQPEEGKIFVTKNHKLRLDRERCKFLFFKNGLPLTANFSESLSKLRLRQTVTAHLKYREPELDIAVPSGKYRHLDKHFTILNEFPRVYGLGDKDLPDDVPEERKAQVKQLEAYLTFYDQLLANYFGQLSAIGDLLSWRENGKQTYVSKYLQHDEQAEMLFFDAGFLRNNLTDAYLDSLGVPDSAASQPRRDFLKSQTGLQHLTESYTTYIDRRNRLLDHLIARFAESFNDYAINMYALPDELVMSDDEVAEKLIVDKISLLRNYPSLSSARGRSFNYSFPDPDPLQTTNLSGYAKRMRSLLGMRFDQSIPLHDLPDDDAGGFHMLEHLLLRPASDGDPLLAVCLNEQCDHCGDEDPYSFRMSVILPFWLKRFTSMPFRNYMETLFRNEAPAHVFLKICWVDREEMAAFENAYAAWITQKALFTAALPAPDADRRQAYTDALGALIQVLESVRTDFPLSTLHDCVDRDEANDTRVFLDHTVLGTFNPTHEDDVPL